MLYSLVFSPVSTFTIFTFAGCGTIILLGAETMALHPKQFGMALKNTRMDKKLTHAELTEKLDISLSYL